MANSDAAFGLIPVCDFGGAPYNGGANRYFVPSTDGTAIFVGDAVKLAGSADADGVPTIAQAAAGDTITGVVVAFDPVEGAGADGRDSTIHRAASTARYAWVVDDPNILFLCQEDSEGGALAAADVGNNADLIVGTGSSTTGRSAMEIDSSTKATTTAQVRVVRLWNSPDNEIGAQAKWLVRIVEHLNATATGV